MSIWEAETKSKHETYLFLLMHEVSIYTSKQLCASCLILGGDQVWNDPFAEIMLVFSKFQILEPFGSGMPGLCLPRYQAEDFCTRGQCGSHSSIKRMVCVPFMDGRAYTGQVRQPSQVQRVTMGGDPGLLFFPIWTRKPSKTHCWLSFALVDLG